ncbi:MAG TPA: DUF4390 domain-containing protein [Burkholderiaceae bacterium]
MLVVLPPPVARAQARSAEVTQMRVDRAEDGLHLSVGVDFDLPIPVEEALTKGIALYFVAEAELLRDRWYWSDKRVAAVTRTMRLSFQPLTRRWRVQISANGQAPNGPELTLGQNFDSLGEALAAVQRIPRWKIADIADVDASSRHTLAFTFRLDVGKLPRPFQIGAVGQNDWNIVARRSQRLAPEPER